MTKLLYLRLSCRNLRRNGQTYLPFLIASSLLTFALYSFSMIAFNPGLQQMRGADAFMMMMMLGLIVVGLFTAVFLFYANSFLIRRRKKELGLYSILGMEKKHVVRVLRHELTLCWLITMVFGLGLGMLLARLLFLVIRALCRMNITLTGSINPTALLVTAAQVTGLYLLLFLYNAFQVRLQKPVELLHGQQTGEKEPKARWILAVVGVVFMIAGYWIAQVVQSPMEAIALFFIAVLLVIAGTYLLFLTGSIALLKLLKKKRSFYYTSKHFVTISGMLYRMKQNAAGLASITILCTMAMVTIGTTVALYNGSESMLNEMYPVDLCVTVDDTQAVAPVISALQAAEEGSAIQPVDRHVFRSRSLWCVVSDETVHSVAMLNEASLTGYENMYVGDLFTLEDWNALQGTSLQLTDGQVAWWGDNAPASLTFLDVPHEVIPVDSVAVIPAKNAGTAYNTLCLIVKDDATAAKLADTLVFREVVRDSVTPQYTIQWNLSGGTDDEKAQEAARLMISLNQAMMDGEKHSFGYSTINKPSMRAEWYALHGGFLFVGVFLGMIFLMGTALIIYFKQISEGYQDHDRFIILQKVGMSQAEVRQTVGRQILIVFFLPLLVAILHVGGSLHMIILMLRLFGLVNVPFIALNTLGSAVIVALLYLLFYRRTAKAYFRLVRF